MRRQRAIDGRDHRHFDVEEVLEDFRAFAKDLVVAGGGEEIEAFGRDPGAELIAVRITTWFSGSSPISRNARTSASCT
jgi:hypothetical protein